MRKLLPVLIVAALLGSLAVATTAISASRSVTVGDNFFRARSLTVSKGTTVTWRWRGRAPHNVVVTRGPVRFSSKTQTKGSYRRKLSRAGTYRIVCTIHAGMAQTIRVRS